MATVELLRRSSCSRRTSVPGRHVRVRGRASALALGVAAMLVVASSAGAGTLDQAQPAISGTAGLVAQTNIWAQTFTNGVSGGLDQVDLAVARQGAGTVSLRVEIRPVSGGVPSGPALASVNVPAASIPPESTPTAFRSVPLMPPAPVTAGAQYAIVVSSASCGFVNCYAWAFGPAGNPYAAGSGFRSADAGATWSPANAFGSTDFAFKTYVLVAPTSKQQCKKGGWKRFANPSFKNQGQCVAYVNHHNAKGKDDASSPGTTNQTSNGQGKKKGHGKKP
jgi:hypothetical protein